MMFIWFIKSIYANIILNIILHKLFFRLLHRLDRPVVVKRHQQALVIGVARWPAGPVDHTLWRTDTAYLGKQSMEMPRRIKKATMRRDAGLSNN